MNERGNAKNQIFPPKVNKVKSLANHLADLDEGGPDEGSNFPTLEDQEKRR